MYVTDNGPRGDVGNGSSLMARTEGMNTARIIERPWEACQVILCGWLRECAVVGGGLEYRTEGSLINGEQGPVVFSHPILMLKMSENDKLLWLVSWVCFVVDKLGFSSSVSHNSYFLSNKDDDFTFETVSLSRSFFYAFPHYFNCLNVKLFLFWGFYCQEISGIPQETLFPPS